MNGWVYWYMKDVHFVSIQYITVLNSGYIQRYIFLSTTQLMYDYQHVH